MTDLKPQSFSESALDKALDEIERLRAENDRLQAALELSKERNRSSRPTPYKYEPGTCSGEENNCEQDEGG